MNELINYLLQHIMIDFEGDLPLDLVKAMLREDSSREAKELLEKLIHDKGSEEMMLALADCLREFIPTGINAAVVREQLTLYSNS